MALEKNKNDISCRSSDPEVARSIKMLWLTNDTMIPEKQNNNPIGPRACWKNPGEEASRSAVDISVRSMFEWLGPAVRLDRRKALIDFDLVVCCLSERALAEPSKLCSFSSYTLSLSFREA